MKTKAVVLTLIFSLLSVALVTGVSAATPAKPSKRDHADAVFYFRASVMVVKSMGSKLDSSQQEAITAVDGCPDAYTGASQSQIRAAEDAVGTILFLQHILPDYAALKRMLVNRHAKNGLLKIIARNVVVINGQLQKYSKETVDVCVLGQDWQVNSWDANYLSTWSNNIDTQSGFAPNVVDHAASQIANQRKQLIKLFGITADQAKLIIDVTTFFSS